MIIVAIIALLLAVVGLGMVRTAPGFARWVALVVAVGFVAVVSLEDRTEVRAVFPRLQSAELEGEAEVARTSMLMAAAMAGPRAVELQLSWRASSKGNADADVDRRSVPSVALGATTIAPEVLPMAPSDVHIRATSKLQVDRPALFEIAADHLSQSLSAYVTVEAGEEVAFQDTLAMGGKPTTVAFTPSRPGAHKISLRIKFGSHQVMVTGSFAVDEAEEVLVVEPSGLAAKALRAQGVRVRELPSWPEDWSRHSRVVLGRLLPEAQQAALVEAVEDGAGLFLLAGAFGQSGMPIRKLLPISPLPPASAADQESGDGSANRANPDPPPDSVSEPPPPSQEPPEVKPPASSDIGDTGGRKPVSDDLVEVDRHSIGMVLVVDRSGSMGTVLSNGRTKMSYAKTSALQTARALDVGDRVAVVTFGDESRSKVELPMTDAVDLEAVRAGISKLAHRNEMTYLLSGLRQAAKLLREEVAAVKHVVVISDGEFMLRQAFALRAVAGSMRRDDKITVSIISIIGDGTYPEFKAKAEGIASSGGGEFIATSDVEVVPVIVSSEVSRALSRVGRKPRVPGNDGEPLADAPPPEPDPPPPDEPDEPDEPEPSPAPETLPRVPVRAVAESPLLSPEPKDWPQLGAAIRAEAPLASRVLLVAGDEGWPLLAYANRGLGRVGAFGVDLGSEACREFCEAKSFPAWLAQWSAQTSVASEDSQAKDLRDGGVISPPAPVPADVRWLSAVGGAATVGDGEPVAVGAAVGSEIVEQVADASPLLLALLLLLAICERITSWYALRRGSC
jgi:Mg-chelatase subunit ChlD